ncbi:Saccharopine dehydrogenase-domain-containing protein [Fusarium oxysporum]|nr:Saccharopine dehydrogenase-domain-containing protein [Fusarium oxysporum]
MPLVKNHGRQYDIVVLGATGYTGKLTAEYISMHLATDLKWAVSGRNEPKLKAVVEECRELNPDRLPPAIEVVNLNDADLSVLAKKTCIIVTTIGPYSLYGEHAYKACAEAGTHYVDVTGEAAWVHKMIKKYEATAKQTGAILIPQAGIESAPADLITWTMAKAIRTDLGSQTRDVVVSLHKINSAPSGGTLATALSIWDVFSLQEIKEASSPYAQSPIPRNNEPTRPRSSILQMIFGVRTIPNLGLQTTSVTNSTDVAVVERTWGLLSSTPSRKDEFYGPNFVWVEHMKARNWLHGIFIHWLLIVGGILLVSVAPLRSFLKKHELEYRGIAYPDSEKAAGKAAFCRMWYHGGMYFLTGMLLAEIAATILEDDIELDGGSYTPACLGQGLVDRLDKSGFRTDVKIIDA